MKKYKEFSIVHQKQEIKSENQNYHIVKSNFIKLFPELIIGVEYINRNYILYAMMSKIQIYKGLTNGELYYTV